MLSLSILGIVVFIILNARELKLFRGHLSPNTVKIMLFISDAQYYIPVKYIEQQVAYIYFKLQEK